MDLFDCVTVIIIVPKPSLGDWMCCACFWMNCAGFDLAVRLNCQKYFCQGQKFFSCSTASPPQTSLLWINSVHFTPSDIFLSLFLFSFIIFPLVFNPCPSSLSIVSFTSHILSCRLFPSSRYYFLFCLLALRLSYSQRHRHAADLSDRY